MNHLIVLKTLRKEKGLSQQAIADKFNITQKAYCNYENGTREPSIKTLIEIANFFNVSVDYIIGNEKKRLYTLTDEEREALEKYKALSEKNKGKVEHYMEQLAAEQEDNKAKNKDVI